MLAIFFICCSSTCSVVRTEPLVIECFMHTDCSYDCPGENPGGVSIGTTAATQIVDPQWNEIDIAFSNLTATPLYGTSLFVSKQPFDYTTYDSNAGFGALQPKGLFSGHDSSGTCVSDTICTAAAASANPPTCPAAPMDYPTASASAIAAGMPATVAGGKGCPKYPSNMMTEYHNVRYMRAMLYALTCTDVLRPHFHKHSTSSSGRPSGWRGWWTTS